MIGIDENQLGDDDATEELKQDIEMLKDEVKALKRCSKRQEI